MLTNSDIMAFAATIDAPRARAFYEGTLGLRLVSDEQYALVFDAQGTMLRVQRVEALTPHPFTSLGWRVDDIATTVRELSERGVVFERYGLPNQDESGIWDSGGGRVAWFKDPDGNLLSLTQF